MAAGNVCTPVRSWSGGHRQRSKGGEKELFRVPLAADASRVDELDALADYDQIFVVDTNTVVIRGEVVSVASVALCSVVRDAVGPGTVITRKTHLGAYEFRGVENTQERFGWFLLQHAIVTSMTYKPNERYLLVTDHALSDHNAINDRQIPMFGETMLAPGLTIGFATSESGRSFLQKAIRECDGFAKDVLQAIRNGQPDDRLFPTSQGPATHLRLFIYDQPKEKHPLEHLTRAFALRADLPFVTALS